jgi:prepilin-type N-terminal cleavage/methylation domain-containing protein
VRVWARPVGHRGFTLIELLLVVAILAIVMGISVPMLNGIVDRQRLGQAAREVERELQVAKQKAVANNRPMRVRFNCPSTGWFRMVELIGTPSQPNAADATTNAARCDIASYPFPADQDPVSRPNLDGPPKRIDPRVVFGTVQTVEFWPDGTARYSTGTNPWTLIPTAGISLTLTYSGSTSTIQVNGLGRISRN